MSEVKKYDKEIEAKLLSMMRENPARLIMYFLCVIGREMVDCNAGSMDFSQELTINDQRYKVELKSVIKKVKSKKHGQLL